MHVSAPYFSRLFKRVMGRTFVDFLTERRVAEAQNLLHMTALPVGEIAARVGYARQSYFTKRFRQCTGMTPRDYRTNRRADGEEGSRAR